MYRRSRGTASRAFSLPSAYATYEKSNAAPWPFGRTLPLAAASASSIRQGTARLSPVSARHTAVYGLDRPFFSRSISSGTASVHFELQSQNSKSLSSHVATVKEVPGAQLVFSSPVTKRLSVRAAKDS